MYSLTNIVISCVVVFTVGYWLGMCDLARFIDYDEDDDDYIPPWEYDDEEL